MTVQSALPRLLAEIDAYLGALTLPGAREVQAGLRAGMASPPTPPAPRTLPACRHLPAALAALDRDGLRSAITAMAPHLSWNRYDAYDPDAIGPYFPNAHAFAPLVGQGAFHHADDFDLGLFVIGPRILYRDHRHRAPELYAPLTGPHGWRFAPDTAFTLKPAHEPVWNEPYQTHATLTGEVPFLCFYGWTRDVGEPARVVPADDWAALERTP